MYMYSFERSQAAKDPGSWQPLRRRAPPAVRPVFPKLEVGVKGEAVSRSCVQVKAMPAPLVFFYLVSWKNTLEHENKTVVVGDVSCDVILHFQRSSRILSSTAATFSAAVCARGPSSLSYAFLIFVSAYGVFSIKRISVTYTAIVKAVVLAITI